MAILPALPVLLASTVLSAAVAGVISLLSQRMNLRHLDRETASRSKDLVRQRVRENSEFMMTLVAIAHGTPADGRRHLAVAEQRTAVEIIVSNANEYPELRKPTEVFLLSGMDYARERLESPSAGLGWKDMLAYYEAAYSRLN